MQKALSKQEILSGIRLALLSLHGVYGQGRKLLSFRCRAPISDLSLSLSHTHMHTKTHSHTTHTHTRQRDAFDSGPLAFQINGNPILGAADLHKSFQIMDDPTAEYKWVVSGEQSKLALIAKVDLKRREVIRVSDDPVMTAFDTDGLSLFPSLSFVFRSLTLSFVFLSLILSSLPQICLFLSTLFH